MARPIDPEQLPLFDPPTVPPVRPGKPVKPGRVQWSKYRPKTPVKCDDCMWALQAAKGNAPASYPAKYRRTQDGGVLLLCYLHAQFRREVDEKSAPE